MKKRVREQRLRSERKNLSQLRAELESDLAEFDVAVKATGLRNPLHPCGCYCDCKRSCPVDTRICIACRFQSHAWNSDRMREDG